MNNCIKIFYVLLILLSISLFCDISYAITEPQAIEDGIYIIKCATNRNYALDVSWGSTENCTNIQLYSVNNTDAQKFKIKYLGNGFFEIESIKSEKVLDVAYACGVPKTNLWQYEKNNTDAQKWIIKKNKDDTYSIISKINDLYIDIEYGVIKNQQNIQLYTGNGTNAQKFIFEKEKTNEEIPNIIAEKTIEDGMYIIRSKIDNNHVIDVSEGSKQNCANIQLYEYNETNAQKFEVKYLNNGYYEIESVISGKVLDVANAGMISGTNLWQYQKNETDAQRWIIKKNEDNTYSIISKLNNLYMDVFEGTARNGQNIQVYNGNGSNAQKFIFEKTQISYGININSSKYPGYKEKLENLKKKHPNWNFELLYTGLNYKEVIDGECYVHSRNLVPTSYSGEWICINCGKTLYDSGWYCASKQAVAYYMDPRNFLDEENIFQFQKLNLYNSSIYNLDKVKKIVNNTFLNEYAYDINLTCKDKNVNPFYIISRIFQEQGKSGSYTGKGMNGGDGKLYYNPFNIGASGNGYEEIYINALKTAKLYGWDTMRKALYGGIDFCKKNWLENYQNTLYQNKFDIDIRNGTSLYTHQYMQNLMGAYSEAKLLKNMYYKTNCLNSNFTFIIPVYENMNIEQYKIPINNCNYVAKIKTNDGNGCNVRCGPSTKLDIITALMDGTSVNVIDKGKYISNDGYDWCQIELNDGRYGFIPIKYLTNI